MASTGEADRFDARFLIGLAAIAGTVTALAASFTLYAGPGSDWNILAPAGRLMLNGDLAVYTHAPKAQVGPLALLFVGAVPFPVYVVAMCCLFPLFVVQAYRVSGARVAVWHLPVFAVLGFAWHRWGAMGHLDDLLVIVAGLGIVIAGQRSRPLVAGVWFAVALAGKPTAVMLLPLVALQSPLVAVAAVAAGGAVYLPFAATDLPGFIEAGRGVIEVRAHSLLDLLGAQVGADFPGWVRPIQLAGALLLGWFVGRRSLLAGLVAVFAFRPLLEPGMFPSYVAAAMLVAFCLEMQVRRWPALTGLLAVSWLASSFAQEYAAVAGLRYAALIVTLALVVANPAARPLLGLRRRVDPARPYSQPVRAGEYAARGRVIAGRDDHDIRFIDPGPGRPVGVFPHVRRADAEIQCAAAVVEPSQERR